MHSALVCVHKCFTLTGGLKSGKCECLWSSAEHTAEAVTRQGKIYLSHSKNRQISTSLCSKSVKTFLTMQLCTLQQHAFTNVLYERVIWNLPRTNVCQTASKTLLKQLLARCTYLTTKKCYYIYWTTKKHAKVYFRMKNPQKTWFPHKKQGKILLARGLSIQQLSALGRWNVTLLLLLLLRKKCEYHRTCCDYLVATACQDFSAWNERKKLQQFHQLALIMFWDFWKSYARTFRRLALLQW